MVSFITDSEVLEVVELPVRNCGTIGTATRQFAGAGTLTAGLCAGGRTTGTVATSEHYDGNSWSAENSLPTATKQFDGCGTQTAALTAGGDQ